MCIHDKNMLIFGYMIYSILINTHACMSHLVRCNNRLTKFSQRLTKFLTKKYKMQHKEYKKNEEAVANIVLQGFFVPKFWVLSKKVCLFVVCFL